MAGRYSIRRLGPFLLMVALFSIPLITLLIIQGGVWFASVKKADWPESEGFKVIGLQEDRTVLLEANDGTETKVWIFGLDIYADDSPVREVLFEITAGELLAPDSTVSCRVRAGFVYPTRTIALCETLMGDLGQELIASGAANLCQRQMKFMPRGLNYTAAQAETHRARLRMETLQSEDCSVRKWATRDNS